MSQNYKKDRIVVGLDIGTTKVCVIVGKINDIGKVDILGIGVAPCNGVKKGEVNNIEKTVEAIKAAKEDAERHANVEIHVVHVGISGEHIRSSQERGIITLHNPDKEISIEDVNRLRDEMLRLNVGAGMQIIHVIPQEYKVDNQKGVKDPIGMSGVRLEGTFHIVMAQTSAINNIHRCVEKAGLEVREVMLQPLASSFAVLSEEEKEAGVCLVDIGGGTTDIVIIEDNIVRHSAIIPLGGQILSEDIKDGCKVMAAQAELLKKQYGSALADENVEDVILSIRGLKDRPNREIHRLTLAKIIQARMEELFELVLLEIENSGYRSKLVAGIVITGGGAELAGLKDLVEYVTGLDARVGYPGEYLDKGLISEVNRAAFATGTGLLLHGLFTESHETSANKRDPQKKIPQTITSETAGIKPKGFISRVKDMFESSINGVSNFIE